MTTENKYTDDEKLKIANTIVRQMGGGGKLRAMVGAKEIFARDAGVQFAFKMFKKANKCVIDCTDNDTYNMSFYKIPHFNANASSSALDRYFDRLEKAKTPVIEFDNIYYD